MKSFILCFVALIYTGVAKAEFATNFTCTFKSTSGSTNVVLGESMNVSYPSFNKTVTLQGRGQGVYSYHAFADLDGFFYSPTNSFILNLEIDEAVYQSPGPARHVTLTKTVTNLFAVDSALALTAANGEDYVLRCFVP